MVTEKELEDCENFYKQLEEYNTSTKPVFILFTAPWCRFCNLASPVIAEAKKSLPEDSFFITVTIAEKDKSKFKDPKCGLLTDKRIKLRGIPLLLLWQSEHRLEGEQCSKKELVETLFQKKKEDNPIDVESISINHEIENQEKVKEK